MNRAILGQIGLTKSEINVYLALLELGSSSTGKIVDTSGASSSKVYEILDRLMQKGLVSFIIKSGVKYFEAAPPERIMDYLKEKETTLNQQKQELKRIIPELELKRQLSKYKSEATIYKGMKGLETAYYSALKLLKPSDEMLVIAGPSRSETINRFFVKFSKERARRKVQMRAIWNERAKGELRTLPEKNPLSEVKYIPQTTSSSVEIFKNRVLIFPKTKDPLVISIDSEEVADSFRVQFEMWWNQKAQTFEGQEGVEFCFQSLIDNAKKCDDVIIFAAKPQTKESADYCVWWNRELRKRVKNIRLLYYGDNEVNKKRAKVISEQGCETSLLPTQQKLPISTIVAGSTILNVIWSKIPSIFKIDNKTVADSLRTNFEKMWNQDTTVNRGFDAMQSELYNMINTIDPEQGYSALNACWGTIENRKKYEEFFKKYHVERIKKQVKARLLFKPGLTDTIEANKKNYERFCEYKIMPYEAESPVETFITKDKVILIIQEDIPTVITVNNKEVARSFMTNFETMWNQETRIVRGMDAIQDIFEDMTEAGHCDFIAARGYFVGSRPKYIDKWEKRAIKKGFTMRNIVDIGTKGHRITTFPFAQTKYTIPKEFSQLSVFWIYGNKVVISNWVEKEPIAVIIENKHLHDMYKQQFELLWKKDKF